MKTVKRALTKNLIISIIFSISFIGGIPAIIFGAINSWWVLMAFGIVCTFVGFYGSPFVWINYGETCKLARLVSAVIEENIYTTKELALQLSISEKEVHKRLDRCFQKRYLLGYRKLEDKIVLNEGKPLEKKKFPAECKCCGAKFFYTQENQYCPYCNTPVNHKTIE